MRLAEFILKNLEPILIEWEIFARGTSPGRAMNTVALRDHAEEILRATARDMESAQTDKEQSDKSKGEGDESRSSRGVDNAAEAHAVDRVSSGFSLIEMFSEYRALRASVTRLWRESHPDLDGEDVTDLIRFDESIDQSLGNATLRYAEQAERARQIFLAILGHDLRNPLSAVIMSNHLLSDPNVTRANVIEATGVINTSCGAMKRIIIDLVEFAGAELGEPMPLKLAPTDLRALCEEVVDEMRSAFPRTPLTFRAGPQDFSGTWDGDRLRQVLSNLLGNAVQHGVGGIDLVLDTRGADVLIVVRNDGPPIPPDLFPTLFNPLVRAGTESEGPKRAGSLGLGLYIVREVVTRQGGTIEVESTQEAGTTFVVCLPRCVPANQKKG